MLLQRGGEKILRRPVDSFSEKIFEEQKEKVMKESEDLLKELKKLITKSLKEKRISISGLSEEMREQLKELVKEVYEDLKNFFGIKKDYLWKIKIEALKDYDKYPDILACYDPISDRIKISKLDLERYLRKLLESEKEKLKKAVRFDIPIVDETTAAKIKLKSILAEELTHNIRWYYLSENNRKWFRDVEEFFGHLAKLHEGEVEYGQEFLKRYVIQREGKWFSDEIYEDIEKKIDEVIEVATNTLLQNDKEMQETIKEKFIEKLFELQDEIHSLEYTIPLNEKENFQPIYENLSLLFKHTIEAINPLAENGFISSEQAKKFLKEIEKNGKEMKIKAQGSKPYRGKEYEELKVYARGYSTAEEVFKHIQQGKIEASDLFYKNPMIIKMLLFDGKKTDYMKKFVWKTYVEAKNFERKLKSYFSRR